MATWDAIEAPSISGSVKLNSFQELKTKLKDTLMKTSL
jgi:hypothetical protein